MIKILLRDYILCHFTVYKTVGYIVSHLIIGIACVVGQVSVIYTHFPGDSDSKESIYNSGDPGSIPRWEKIPWRRAWQPTPVVLPGEFHGQRSLVGYSPWGLKESDMT